ncbi:MAG TPA: dihydroneopterin aldolase [Hyphomicrobiaceae bacterium]|nr:dihydroneopterin aldolase [Hyphomicrobiaceae bacterium]
MDQIDKKPGYKGFDASVCSGRTSTTVPRSRRVIVDRFELTGSVGIYEHERRARQPLVVSLGLTVFDDYDGHSDKIENVYDYDLAIEAIRSSVENGHINLLETLAERIAEACLSDPRVLSADVRIEKPAVLPACRSVGIEIHRSR